MCSAIAATGVPALVMAKGHVIDGIAEVRNWFSTRRGNYDEQIRALDYDLCDYFLDNWFLADGG